MPCDDPRFAYNASLDCGPPQVCKQVMSWTATTATCIGVPTPTHCAAPKLGGMAGEGCDLVLECAAGGKIASIEFADWGQPTAVGADPYDPAACEFQAAANCTAGPHIKSLVESLCVGKSRCTIATSDLNSPDPCSGHHKRVAVRASGCTPAKLPPAKPKTSFVSTTGGGTLGYCNSDTAGLSNGRPFIQNASSGPLPHSRWFGPYGSESEFVWEGNGTQIVSASAHPVIDDDCVGGITTDPRPANWCMEAVRGGNLEVWVAELSGHRLALALVNRSPKHATITAPWEAIGLLASKKMSVRDVWAAADKGTHAGEYSTEVAGKGVALLVLSPSDEVGPAPFRCRSNEDCQLNGQCSSAGACQCDAAWKGEQCQLLNLLPASIDAGLQDPQLLS